MQPSKAQANKWHMSSVRAGLTVKAGGGSSSNHTLCFNILREASETLETETSSVTANLTPKFGMECLWD